MLCNHLQIHSILFQTIQFYQERLSNTLIHILYTRTSVGYKYQKQDTICLEITNQIHDDTRIWNSNYCITSRIFNPHNPENDHEKISIYILQRYDKNVIKYYHVLLLSYMPKQ